MLLITNDYKEASQSISKQQQDLFLCFEDWVDHFGLCLACGCIFLLRPRYETAL